MSDKPLVFNYRDYEELKNRCTYLEAKVMHQADKVNELMEENTNLKIDVDNYKSKYETACLIIDTNHEMIQTYTKIFKMQEAELQKLRKEALDV